MPARATARSRQQPIARLADDPLWYKDAIFYELRVRSFYDSNGDGIGDLRGLIEKLDYLQDLGVNTLWLLPFYPSALKDDGYDIADYMDVHPEAGSLADFKLLLREAHCRGLRVVTELVLNHTSDKHPWFQRARRAKPGSRWRNFYVWSDTPDRYADARIIFKDFETSNWTWDPVAGAYFWHRFYSHQPDLNFESPDVRKAVKEIVDFWLSMGVDGLRLDAVPYLFEREGTNCENLQETHDYLRDLRRHIDERFPNRMLLAEANQWPEDSAKYFGQGDECHMAFHFPIMPRMFMAIQMEDRYALLDILAQTPVLPEKAQWALFLRNHDELTLEMVTDEERDYMYRMYARDPQARINLGIRRRLAPLLGSNRRKIELMNSLLFSMPGTPVLYYGDEIGMGDNIYLGDRNGVRTPMQWSADRNAGFSRANPQKLYLPVVIDPEYHFETVNVEAQQANPQSLLWWMKRLIALRKRFKAFGRGSLEFLHPDNPRVLAFLRQYGDEVILVIANLSRFVQYAQLDLSQFKGMSPVELFGRTEFPPIDERPYFMTLGPHMFYWFALQRTERAPELGVPRTGGLPTLRVAGHWQDVLEGGARARLEDALPGFLRSQRWFGGKARRLRSVHLSRAIPVPMEAEIALVTSVGVDYTDGAAESYLLPLAYAEGERAAALRREFPTSIVANLKTDTGSEGILFDALVDETFAAALLGAIANRRRLRSDGNLLVGSRMRSAHALHETVDSIRLMRDEQSNTSVIFSDRFILKVFRRLERGVNPDLELGRFLTKKGGVSTPKVAGFLEHRSPEGNTTLGILHEFVPNQGSAWTYTLAEVERYYERALALGSCEEANQPLRHPLDLTEQAPSPLARDLLGTYLETARLLGTRTAELHRALASEPDNPEFAPEPFTTLYQRSLFQSMQSHLTPVFNLLGDRINQLPEPVQESARAVLAQKPAIVKRMRSLLGSKLSGMRIRHHGDYHLGQVLYTGRDFVILDFEGEPARPLSERKLKRSALRDVAGMLRSFHYAAFAPLLRHRGGGARPDLSAVEPWARFWLAWASSSFLKAYLAEVGTASFLPKKREEVRVLLDTFVLEKAVYELGYELNNRPDWVRIPLQGIEDLLHTE